MRAIVAKMLGEAADAPDTKEQTAAVEPQRPAELAYTSPSVERLVSLWQSGQHEAVAVRVLDALDSYSDFMELAFQIGHDDAIQLGEIMDSMTADEKSPHTYDEVPDQDVSMKAGRKPDAGEAHNAVGE
jgi:hypothetical protein